MTLKTTTIQSLNFKTERDLVLVIILSTLLIAVITFFPDSPARIILGLPFILFFSGYVLICALFPRKEDLDIIERLALSFGLSIAVTSLIGLALNYTSFGIRLYPVMLSLFLFMLLMSAVAIYRRRTFTKKEVFAPLASISISGWRERVKSEFIKSYEWNRIIKIIAIIAFTFITLALILIRNSPATGYEASIYAATPILAWFFLISSFACGIGIAVYEVYQKDENRNKLWAIGLLLILLPSLAILGLHHIRGYFFYGAGDTATHLGYAQEIISSGHAGGQNIYPIIHILSAQLSQVLDTECIILFGVIPSIFYILYAVFLYLFARTVLPSKGHAILATVAGLTFQYGWWLMYTAPNQLANLTLPLAFYLFTKSSIVTESKAKMSFTILFAIILILFPVLHPIPAIVLIILLLTIWLPGKVSVSQSKNVAISTEKSYKFRSAASLLLIVWFITWISSFYVWESTIRNIHFLLTAGGPTNIDALREQMLYAEGYGYSVMEQFFKVYGGILVYVVLTLVAFLVLIKRMRVDINLRNLFAFYAPLIAFAFFVAVGYGSNTCGLTRILYISIILCSLFVGFLLYEWLGHKFSRNYWRTACLFGVIFLLIMVSSHGVLKLYPSPYTLYPNDQVTQAEVKGMDWFFHSKDVITPWLSMTIGPYRYANMLLTQEERAGRKDSPRSTLWPPYHFGYPENDSLGDQYEKDHYMTLNKKDRLIYTEIFPDMAKLRFLPRDFEQLENDASINKLYSSGGFDAYFIRARVS
ncbi:hypothetical protein C4E24_02490 [ANME-1 cluster archaeon AG-394-G21]|nr:hypothetical protein [ANME-1 cluster archaeon AG-394-G21]